MAEKEEAFLESLRRGWRRREAEEREQESQRRQLALAKAKRAAQYLKDRYGTKEVYLFGSLVYGLHFTVHSDIDLLAVGFPEEANYWHALAEIEGITRPFPVSLVLEENAVPGLRETARKKGIQL
ncbi:MAG: nucleotidyltransferase domain-containing protein [Firmicutes bacterium]|nr:nucleotidyltransferase domain-containing protein [Bacillota bacterium]